MTAALNVAANDGRSARMIVYTSLSFVVDGARVPVAAWHQRALRGGRREENEYDAALDEATSTAVATYKHRISVSAIGRGVSRDGTFRLSWIATFPQQRWR